jgi:hypothetical protein
MTVVGLKTRNQVPAYKTFISSYFLQHWKGIEMKIDAIVSLGLSNFVTPECPTHYIHPIVARPKSGLV